MNAHTEEEEKVDDAMLLGEDNPHAYLFGGDPIEPAAPEPYREPPVISQPVPPAPLPTIQPTSPKQVVAPPISSVSGSVPEPRRTVRPGEFDERFKATVEYQSIMMTLVRLKDQREQAIADLKRLETERQKAQENPQAFVSTLLSKREVLPRRQVPPAVPTIDFTIYEKLSQKPGGVVKVEQTRPAKRTASAPKSVANHTPWTLEEQHRLEQLLIEYPDEPVAAYRWEKIARALGRTPKQVVSRIHRYFERLARAGLPIPGRLPTSSRQTAPGGSENSRQASSSSSHAAPRAYNVLEAPAIKMQSALPVIDDSNVLSEQEKAAFSGLEHTEEYKELIRLKRLKQLQERSGEHFVQIRDPSVTNGSKTAAGEVHHGSECSSCLASPIYGTLYNCTQCHQPRTTLCANCHAMNSFVNEHHSLDHTFDVEQSVQFVDSDYALTDEMAYLDPNYGAAE